MATGDKKRAVMTTDINDANGSYGVIGMSKKGAANGVAELDSTGKVPASQLPSGAGPSPSSATPLMNGVGDAGSSTDYSRGDHVHPSDTTKLGTSGDGSNVTAAFTAASSRTNISTGEKLSVIFGKIAKWFADLGAAAFRGVDATPTAGSTNLVESDGVKSALNSVENDIAIRVVGNKTTYASGAAIGQYVIVDGSTITGIADGLYKAAKAIPYNTVIDSTYLTAVSGGGINDLKAALRPSTLSFTITPSEDKYIDFPFSNIIIGGNCYDPGYDVWYDYVQPVADGMQLVRTISQLRCINGTSRTYNVYLKYIDGTDT